MKHKRALLVYIVLLLLLLLLAGLSLGIGSVRLEAGRIPQILTGGGTEQERNILMLLRLPRLLSVLILCGALAVSGFLLQTFFANPIAGPYVLGISSGAKLVVAALMIIVLERAGTLSTMGLVLAAFAGAFLTTLVIILVSQRVRHMAALLTAGVMIGYISSAFTELLISFADEREIVNLHSWSQGSFSGSSWETVRMSCAITLVVMILVLAFAKPIGAFLMGERYAVSMGVNVRMFRFLLILLSSVLSAEVAAFAGPVAFIGISVPYVIKVLMKSAKPLLVIPAVFLGGSVFGLFADLVARTAFAPSELAISTVTSLFGAPLVIFMLIRHGRRT